MLRPILATQGKTRRQIRKVSLERSTARHARIHILNVNLDASEQIPPVQRLLDIGVRASVISLKVKQHLAMPLHRILLRRRGRNSWVVEDICQLGDGRRELERGRGWISKKCLRLVSPALSSLSISPRSATFQSPLPARCSRPSVPCFPPCGPLRRQRQAMQTRPDLLC